jgi:hypothetical protein
MTKLWTIWLSNGLEANTHYLNNYDEVLRVVQSELDDGYFDLTEIMIEELETTND